MVGVSGWGVDANEPRRVAPTVLMGGLAWPAKAGSGQHPGSGCFLFVHTWVHVSGGEQRAQRAILKRRVGHAERLTAGGARCRRAKLLVLLLSSHPPTSTFGALDG